MDQLRIGVLEIYPCCRNPGNLVVLSVALRQNASAFEAVDAVVVFDGTGERQFTLPTAVKSGEPPQQSLGPYPQNGRFRIEVRDTDGKTLDFVEIEYSLWWGNRYGRAVLTDFHGRGH